MKTMCDPYVWNMNNVGSDYNKGRRTFTYFSVMYKVAVPNSWPSTKSLVPGVWQSIPSTGAENVDETTTISNNLEHRPRDS